MKVVAFILFIAFCVCGYKGCSMINGHESSEFRTVSATVIDKYTYIGSGVNYGSKRYFVAVLRPDVENPRIVDDYIDEALWNRISKGSKITITYRNYCLTTDYEEGLSTFGAFLGFISWALAIRFGLVLISNDDN